MLKVDIIGERCSCDNTPVCPRVEGGGQAIRVTAWDSYQPSGGESRRTAQGKHLDDMDTVAGSIQARVHLEHVNSTFQEPKTVPDLAEMGGETTDLAPDRASTGVTRRLYQRHRQNGKSCVQPPEGRPVERILGWGFGTEMGWLRCVPCLIPPVKYGTLFDPQERWELCGRSSRPPLFALVCVSGVFPGVGITGRRYKSV